MYLWFREDGSFGGLVELNGTCLFKNTNDYFINTEKLDIEKLYKILKGCIKNDRDN